MVQLEKSLSVDPHLCTGCRICEIQCSMEHLKESRPSRALIHVVRLDSEGLFIPTVCKHCAEAFCMYACPTGAIYREDSTQAVLVDQSKCVRCRSCMLACPWGLIWMGAEGKVEKCDLCNGDPACARWCPTGAVKYDRSDRQHVQKMSRAAIKDVNALVKQKRVLKRLYYSAVQRILSRHRSEE